MQILFASPTTRQTRKPPVSPPQNRGTGPVVQLASKTEATFVSSESFPFHKGPRTDPLEVQPPFLIGWFPKHHFFTRGLSSSKSNQHFFEMVVDFQGIVINGVKYMGPVETPSKWLTGETNG